MIWKASPVSEKGNPLSAEFGGRHFCFCRTIMILDATIWPCRQVKNRSTNSELI